MVQISLYNDTAVALVACAIFFFFAAIYGCVKAVERDDEGGGCALLGLAFTVLVVSICAKVMM